CQSVLANRQQPPHPRMSTWVSQSDEKGFINSNWTATNCLSKPNRNDPCFVGQPLISYENL
ncbi:MAG: hypothetical protein AB8B45_05540, partial [Prochlorococcus sp.]